MEIAEFYGEFMLLIVPASGREAYEHFRKTIEKTWSITELLSLGVNLPIDVIEKLRSVERFCIWGCLPSVKGIDKAWPEIDKEWVVAFYREGYIVCYGVVFAKVRSPELAERLWGRDRNGRTWEYVYFIRDISWTRIPWKLVKEELGYKIERPQGHLFVDPERVRRIVEKYGSVLSFFESLKKRVGVDDTDRGRARYRAEELYLPSLGTPILSRVTGIDDAYTASLYLYGSALRVLSSYVVHGAVEREVFESLMHGERHEHRARLYNDLRRLCIVSLGRGGDWHRDTSAAITKLGLSIVRAALLLKELGMEVSEVELGALSIAFCLAGNVESCIEEEAGVCIALAEKGLGIQDSQTKKVAERALEVLRFRPELMFLAMGYGAKIKI